MHHYHTLPVPTVQYYRTLMNVNFNTCTCMFEEKVTYVLGNSSAQYLHVVLNHCIDSLIPFSMKLMHKSADQFESFGEMIAPSMLTHNHSLHT